MKPQRLLVCNEKVKAWTTSQIMNRLFNNDNHCVKSNMQPALKQQLNFLFLLSVYTDFQQPYQLFTTNIFTLVCHFALWVTTSSATVSVTLVILNPAPADGYEEWRSVWKPTWQRFFFLSSQVETRLYCPVTADRCTVYIGLRPEKRCQLQLGHTQTAALQAVLRPAWKKHNEHE